VLERNALRQYVALIQTWLKRQTKIPKITHVLYFKGNLMSVTMHITITTKEGCFDEFHALAKEELAFTRGSKGCVSIQTSSSKDTNTLKFAEVWDSEDDFNTYFAKRVERSGEDFGRLLEGPPEKECFQTDDWGYGKEWQK
jgi:quinol monooxygenase YgiN